MRSHRSRRLLFCLLACSAFVLSCDDSALIEKKGAQGGAGKAGSSAGGQTAAGGGASGGSTGGAGAGACGSLPAVTSTDAPRTLTSTACTFSDGLGTLAVGQHLLSAAATTASGSVVVYLTLDNGLRRYTLAPGGGCSLKRDVAFPTGDPDAPCLQVSTDAGGGVWCFGLNAAKERGFGRILPTQTAFCTPPDAPQGYIAAAASPALPLTVFSSGPLRKWTFTETGCSGSAATTCSAELSALGTFATDLAGQLHIVDGDAPVEAFSLKGEPLYSYGQGLLAGYPMLAACGTGTCVLTETGSAFGPSAVLAYEAGTLVARADLPAPPSTAQEIPLYEIVAVGKDVLVLTRDSDDLGADGRHRVLATRIMGL